MLYLSICFILAENVIHRSYHIYIHVILCHLYIHSSLLEYMAACC